jgi:linoleate 9S-lipoxygenase
LKKKKEKKVRNCDIRLDIVFLCLNSVVELRPHQLYFYFNVNNIFLFFLSRGVAVEDPNSPHGLRLLIEDYPFAADGLEIWAAIKSWVDEYVNFYYKSDLDIVQDSELQAFWKELVEVGHGDLKNATWWYKMQNCSELIEACTTLIWIASALHVAVNFGQ